MDSAHRSNKTQPEGDSKDDCKAVIDQLKSLTNVKSGPIPADENGFSSLILPKLEKNGFTFSCENPITKWCSLAHGFAIALECGNVVVVLPPCAKTVKITSAGEIIALVSFDAETVLAFTDSYYYSIKPDSLIFERVSEFPGISCAASFEREGDLILGFTAGSVNYWVDFYGRPDLLREYILPEECRHPDCSVKSINTVENEPWFLVQYSNNLLVMWKRQETAMLYRLRMVYGASVPTSLPLGQETIFPYWTSCIAFEPTRIVMMDYQDNKLYADLKVKNGVLWEVSTSMNKLDYLQYCAHKENCANFRIPDFCVFLIPKGKDMSWLKNELDADNALGAVTMRVETEFSYENWAISKDGLYVCLIGAIDLKVLSIGAIECTLTHTFDENYYYASKKTEKKNIFHQRFGGLFRSDKTQLFSDEEWKYLNPTLLPDPMLFHMQKDNEWQLLKIKDSQQIEEKKEPPTREAEMPHSSQSAREVTKLEDSKRGKPGSQMEVILTERQRVGKVICNQLGSVVVLITNDLVKVCTLDSTLPLEARISQGGMNMGLQEYYWKKDKYLFAFAPRVGGIVLTISPSDPITEELLQNDESFETSFEKEFEVSEVSEVSELSEVSKLSCDFILKCPDKTSYFSWGQPDRCFSVAEPYFDFKPFADGEFCAANSNLGTFVLKLPTLQPLMKFEQSWQLSVSWTGKKEFLAYCADPEDKEFGIVKRWDLDIGIPVRSLDFGLKPFADFSLSRKYLFRRPNNTSNVRAEYCSLSSPILESLWEFSPDEDCNNKLRLLGAETLAAYCCALKQLNIFLIQKHASVILNDATCRLVAYPQRVNILHFLSYQREAQLIPSAFALSAKFIKGTSGTPVTLCLKLRIDDCLERLLEGLIAMQVSNPDEFLIALHQLDDDFADLLRSDSVNLGAFLETILVPLPRQMINAPINAIVRKPPKPKFQNDLFQRPLDPCYLWKFLSLHETRLEFSICPIGLNVNAVTANGEKLFANLKKSDPTRNILSRPMIKLLAELKWKSVQIPWVVLNVVYWILLAMIVCRIYDYGDQLGVSITILVLNSIFLIIELVQIWRNGSSTYAKNPWNLIDVARIGFTYSFAIVSDRIWLTFVTVALSAIRGLTTFECIDETRFLVKMILKVCKETVFFVLVFVYSNLCFGVLLRVAQENSEYINFWESWKRSFELSMGGFDMSEALVLRWIVFFLASVVNVIWMLNLLISILGTAYDNFTTQIMAEDVRTQFELVYEMERMNIYSFLKNRQDTSPRYLVVFDVKAKESNPRSEQVTLFALQQEIGGLSEEMAARMGRMERMLNAVPQTMKETLAKERKVAKEAEMGKETVSREEFVNRMQAMERKLDEILLSIKK